MGLLNELFNIYCVNYCILCLINFLEIIRNISLQELPCQREKYITQPFTVWK